MPHPNKRQQQHELPPPPHRHIVHLAACDTSAGARLFAIADDATLWMAAPNTISGVYEWHQLPELPQGE